MSRFDTNHDLRISTLRIGQSAEPVLVIDDFLQNPEDLVRAATQSPWRDLPPGGYPGQRTGLPGDYARAVLRRLDGVIRKRLLPADMVLNRFECSFSMVTRAQDDLTVLQRVPHIDIASEYRVAILHYLCPSQFGGTAFFQQDATGLEQIAPADQPRYLAARTASLEDLQTQHAYPGTDTPGYTRTGFTQARFNRLVAYRSFTLHSGIIHEPAHLTSDPATGRLTANFFVDYIPAT